MGRAPAWPDQPGSLARVGGSQLEAYFGRANLRALKVQVYCYWWPTDTFPMSTARLRAHSIFPFFSWFLL